MGEGWASPVEVEARSRAERSGIMKADLWRIVAIILELLLDAGFEI